MSSIIGDIFRGVGELIGGAADFVGDLVFGKDKRMDIFIPVVAMLGKAAKCDGRVSKQEITYMNSLFEDWELDSTQRKRYIDVFNNAKNDKSFDIFYCARKINSCLENTEEGLNLRITIYAGLCEMMLADGEISAEEDKILRLIPQDLGLPNEIYSRFFENNSSNDSHMQQVSLDECYKILGCSSSASNDEIKRAYKKQIRSYHPDMIASKELAPEFMEFAKQQTQRITEAYDTIRKERGF